jgi:hypothetical protein
MINRLEYRWSVDDHTVEAVEGEPANLEVLRLQLQQTIDWMRQLVGFLVQASGFFLAADALLLGYGITQKKAVFLLLAGFSVAGILVTGWLFARASIPANYVAIHLERRLLGSGSVGLASFVLRIENRRIYDRLIRADHVEDAERAKLVRQTLRLRDFVMYSGAIALFALLLGQIALFGISLAVLEFSFA